MLYAASLPFVVHRKQEVVSGSEVTSTRETLHGLLRLGGDRLVVQWRTTREVSHVGREIRTDRDLAPLREASVPLAGLAGAHVRRVWDRWWFADALVLNASDMEAFDGLANDADAPGLVLEHPAEIVLRLRRTDRGQAQHFASELGLAISELRLAASEEAHARLLDEEPAPVGGALSLDPPPPEEAGRARRRGQQRG